MKKQAFKAFINRLTSKTKKKKGAETMGNQMLNGINEICSFVDREPATVMEWKNFFNFPMKRDKANVWTANQEDIKAWFKARKCSPRTATNEKLERYELLKRQAAGKGKKYKRKLTGLKAIADFLGINDHLKPYDWMRFYDNCPIHRNEHLQPTVDADELLQWLAKVELDTGKDLTR